MLTLQLLTIFIAAILLTAAQVFDEFITVVKNDRKKALFWGFLTWVLAGTIIVNIDGSAVFKVFSVLFAGFGSAVGNLIGIELISILKKQKRSKKPFMKLAAAGIKKSNFYKSFRKLVVIPRKRKKIPSVQPEVYFREVF